MKITEKQKEVQAEIDALLEKGMVVEAEQEPSRSPILGVYCSCCGKDGRAIIEVYAFEQGKKDHADPMSQVAFVFGRSCIKKFRFKKKINDCSEARERKFESKQETLYSAAITIGLEFGMKPQQSLRLLENLSSLTDGERTYTEIVEALTKK